MQNDATIASAGVTSVLQDAQRQQNLAANKDKLLAFISASVIGSHQTTSI